MKALFTTALLLLSSQTMASVCVDDPRMFTIKTVIEQMEAGQDVPALKLTPLTFLSLTPVVREALGDNVTVYNEKCVPVQVYKQTLPKPVVVPFENLLTAFKSTVYQDDQQASLAILANFTAAPKSASEIHDLIPPLSWQSRHLEKLYQWGVFDKLSTSNTLPDNQHKYCSKAAAIPSLADLYALLNGHVEGFNKLGIATKYETFNIYTPTEVETAQTVIADGKKCSILNISRTIESLQHTGLSLININDTNTSDGLKAVKEAHDAHHSKGQEGSAWAEQ